MKKILALCIIVANLNSLTAQYTTNGTATQLNESCIRVTEAVMTQVGSAYFNTPLDLSQPFSFSGTMFFGADDAGADGMTFILATDPTAQGISGGGIGYEGITPSLIVEFDTWQNAEIGDVVQDHMGIMSNGVANHNAPETLAPLVILPNIEDNMEHCFTIMWDPAVPIFEATLSSTSITYNGDISALFPAGVDVYYGYTGSTGGAVNEQRVCLYNTDELEDVAITEVPPICIGSGIQTLSANLPGGTWGGAANENGQVNPSNLGAGTYAVTYVLGDFECEYSDEITIEILPAVQINLVSQTDIDCTQQTGSLEVQGENGLEPFSYLWSNGETTSIIQNLSVGTYTVTITDSNGCQESETYQITAESLHQIESIEIVPQLCDEDNTIQGGSLLVTVIGGSLPYLYSIDGGTTFQAENIFTDLTGGNGTVTVSDNSGCLVSQDYEFSFADYPTIEIQASSLEFCSESIALSVVSQDTESILWSTSEITNTISLAEAGTVTVVATNEFNCTAQTEVIITECLNYDIPNVFTPNNDDVNETFGLVTESENITFFLSVYSRWGQLVYEGNQNWDGNVEGKPFPADVLSYVMEVNIRGNVVVERGDITLVR
jgi:gliding motility-associated-like protein